MTETGVTPRDIVEVIGPNWFAVLNEKRSETEVGLNFDIGLGLRYRPTPAP